jgi:hypothetical protein
MQCRHRAARSSLAPSPPSARPPSEKRLLREGEWKILRDRMRVAGVDATPANDLCRPSSAKRPYRHRGPDRARGRRRRLRRRRFWRRLDASRTRQLGVRRASLRASAIRTRRQPHSRVSPPRKRDGGSQRHALAALRRSGLSPGTGAGPGARGPAGTPPASGRRNRAGW